MNTPICDFVRRYAVSGALRLHMPGHKGVNILGAEPFDITEIEGADSLYEASGIIHESEANAGMLFGAKTFYSAEGSSLCIRAMLYLTVQYLRANGKKPLIAAGRNAHKTFLSAAALLDFDVAWIYPKSTDSYLSCTVDADTLEEYFEALEYKPTAVYLTSPDYLGNTADLSAVSKVCRKHGALLLVDNAHGAYLKFLSESRHPIDLGADICCDSAHKTLPALTGAAYLHISPMAPDIFAEQAKSALAMFASTSPSYLIMQSLDILNKYLDDGYAGKLDCFIKKVNECKHILTSHGYTFLGDEPLKLTVFAKPYGYSGRELAALLHEKNIVCEFADPDFTVLMLTPEVGKEGLERLADAMLSIPKRDAIGESAPPMCKHERVMSIREAAFSACEAVDAQKSFGRVLAAASVSCPPAVPIVVCGERIDEDAVNSFKYYGIQNVTVVK